MFGSRADSSTTKYMYAFQRWKRWAEPRLEVSEFPMQEVHFALYLQHVCETTGKAAIEGAINAIGWLQKLSGLPPVASSPFVRATLEGLQRKLAKPKVRKEPITAGMLTTWVESLGPEPSLADVRLVAIALLAFSAFLQYDELSKLRGCDIRVTPQSMSVHVTSSKTDQYHKGASILVARSGSPTCPVAMVERYLAPAGISRDSKLRLFRGIVHAKGGDCLRSSGSLSYTRMRELLLEKITQLGFDPKLFGLHSLRAGGATAAANAGVADS